MIRLQQPKYVMKPADRRFIEYWQDQRKGSKSGYYITYTIGWGILFFFAFFFLSKLFTNLWKTGGPYLALIFIGISLVLSVFVTHSIWTRNENRLKRLIKKQDKELN